MADPTAAAAPTTEEHERTTDEHEAVSGAEETLVEQDLLVEDVSIDGMCGVY